MSYNTIPQTTQFNTGFLQNQTLERFKQGLFSQEIANNCLVGKQSIAQNTTVKSSTQLECNTKAMYSSPVTHLSYDGKKNAFPDNCSCTRFIQSP